MSLLAVRDLSKRFGGLVAVDDVSFDVYEGTIKALIGPNGAGKSTLFNLLTGFDREDSGSVRFAGEPLDRRRPHSVVRAGIARTFQNTQLFEDLTVRDNVIVGMHTRFRTGFVAGALRLGVARREDRTAEQDAERLLRLLGVARYATIRASDVPHGARRLTEIARALGACPTVLLLDEPAAGLNATETYALSQALRRIRDEGVTILVVEHDMGLVMEISDEIVVLDRGRKIAEGPPLLIQKDAAVIEAYLGEEVLDA
ncbi:MAG TPA: ABC transporter ATP-binding protein [Coriobacteriia bacterium]|nr:ABC transporter ATP-binding protein [Coriobacteriia bacterium]